MLGAVSHGCVNSLSGQGLSVRCVFLCWFARLSLGLIQLIHKRLNNHYQASSLEKFWPKALKRSLNLKSSFWIKLKHLCWIFITLEHFFPSVCRGLAQKVTLVQTIPKCFKFFLFHQRALTVQADASVILPVTLEFFYKSWIFSIITMTSG